MIFRKNEASYLNKIVINFAIVYLLNVIHVSFGHSLGSHKLTRQGESDENMDNSNTQLELKLVNELLYLKKQNDLLKKEALVLLKSNKDNEDDEVTKLESGLNLADLESNDDNFLKNNDDDQISVDGEYDNKKISKRFFGFLTTTKQNKPSFKIQTYYDTLVRNDGSVMFIPKDVNKNHYFIG